MPITTTLLRARAQSVYLTSRCLLRVPSLTTNADGTPATAWNVIATSQPCRLIRASLSKSNATAIDEGQVLSVEDYRLVLADSVTLDVGSQAIISNVIYDIVRLDQNLTESFFHHYVIARQYGEYSR